MRFALVMPRYNEQCTFEAATAFYHPLKAGSPNRVVTPISPASSLLACCFNMGWTHALDRFEAGDIDAFAMIHSDQAPEPGWLDILHDELIASGADIMSAVCPIKDDRGLTSTAVDDSGCTWRPRRLTMHEILMLPTTFTDADVGGELLLNTGLWICKLGPWALEKNPDGSLKHCFRITDMCRKEGDRHVARVQPEDWDFSRQLRRAGLKLGATRAVQLNHWGATRYPNFEKWGWEEDLQNGPNASWRKPADPAPAEPAAPAAEPELVGT
jgi:hypothetical protein